MTTATAKNFRLAGFIAALFLLAALLTVSARAGSASDKILLSWTGDTSTTQTVSWQSETNAESYVQYIDEARYNQTGFVGAARVTAAYKDISLDSSGAWRFEACLAGLSPGMRYVYRVGNDSGWSESAAFTTADPQAGAFSFVYMGDIQVTAGVETDYTLWGELAASAYQKAPETAFALLGGDIVESGISLAQFDSFMKNASPIFSKIPIMPTNGNHESNFIGGKPELYLDVFALPENGPEGFTEEFYSFDYGNCHITVLNSHVFSGEQFLAEDDYARVARWIENDLRQSSAIWKIVLMHHPAYPVHSDKVANAVQENWAPVFEANGVSLVFVGHQHVYSRSFPMYGGSVDFENGIVYIMGNSGQKFYSSADERHSERTIYNTATYQLVRVDGDSLTVQTCDINGTELDYCVLSPRASKLSFPDVSESDWYYAAAGYAMGGRLFDPIDGRFAPDEPMTRLMFAEALYRLAGSPTVSALSPFSDSEVPSVIWAYGDGIVKGISDTEFSPGGTLTREQAATMLYRYYEALGMDTDMRGGTQSFSDADSISDWARDAVSWAAGMKLIRGMGDGTVAPQGELSRAQAAQILLNTEG